MKSPVSKSFSIASSITSPQTTSWLTLIVRRSPPGCRGDGLAGLLSREVLPSLGADKERQRYVGCTVETQFFQLSQKVHPDRPVNVLGLIDLRWREYISSVTLPSRHPHEFCK